jgi:uncharacterized DUF497 family protein
MKLISDEYIEFWFDEVWDSSLDWDEANLRKLSKHGLESSDVGELVSRPFSIEGRIAPTEAEDWNESRYLLLGFIGSGKGYALIFTTRETKLRPITCRRMRPNEEKNFKKFIKG